MKNVLSLIVGSALTLVLCLIWIGIVPANPTYRYSGIVAIVLIVFIAGLRKVPVQHEEVVEFLGARSKLRFKEGVRWLLWFFSGTEDVNMKIKKVDVPSLTEISKNKVPLKVETSIFFQVTNPSTFLNLDENIVLDGLKSLAQEAIREFIIEHTDLQCLREKTEIQKCVEDNIDKETKDKWGIDIENVDVKTALPSEAILKEYEEDKKKELKITRFAKDLKKIAKEVPNISDKEKVDTVEVVEGIVKKELKAQQTTMKVGVEAETIKTVAEIIAMFLPKKKTDETKPEEGERK